MSEASADAMEASDKTSPPVWFWVISIVALLWYLMDTSAFFMRLFMTDDAIKAMPENQQHLYRDMPLWVNIVFACEVFGGAVGCISLLLRKKWALPLFVISLLGVLAQTSNIHNEPEDVRIFSCDMYGYSGLHFCAGLRHTCWLPCQAFFTSEFGIAAMPQNAHLAVANMPIALYL